MWIRGNEDNEDGLCTTHDASCVLSHLKGGAAADTENGEGEVSVERVDREKDLFQSPPSPPPWSVSVKHDTDNMESGGVSVSL